ncbi:MAG TPA: Gfo/Idh/MocA family oxidoreductase [Candidatus Hydrogenedentes bacterium]|nr:Gfo/Idh/MocA family oxidoreductase [Candidatus Hydrogenedentota bacterium]HOJ68136.1 Gfo/Idh/MocA family oxidoreductase [Candidatus Hydrogenedentota bacterium]HOK89526.1 Gfo/Idh/MocA family oxidoreductase [Candidatus Hydrogenedentota bacterium]
MAVGKKKQPLRVGVVGVGAIAREQHLPYWRELEAEGRVQVTGLCDILVNRCEAEAATCPAAEVFSDYREMLRKKTFDIVDICTQNRLHAPVTIDALKAGAHVLVEKPMAMNARECEAMIAAARKNNRKLMVAQYLRFDPLSEKLKEVAVSGALGEIYTAEARWMRRRGIPGWGKFHIAAESLGGPLIDIGVHVIDLAMWLMNFPRPVAASGKVYRKFGDRPDLFNADWPILYKPREFDVEDYAVALIRCEGGLTLNLCVSWAANIEKELESVFVLGDKGGISTNPPGLFGADHNALTRTTWDWLSKEDGHRREIRHFCACVEQDQPVMVKPEESLMVQKIIDAIYLSSEKDREVPIR